MTSTLTTTTISTGTIGTIIIDREAVIAPAIDQAREIVRRSCRPEENGTIIQVTAATRRTATAEQQIDLAAMRVNNLVAAHDLPRYLLAEPVLAQAIGRVAALLEIGPRLFLPVEIDLGAERQVGLEAELERGRQLVHRVRAERTELVIGAYRRVREAAVRLAVVAEILLAPAA